VALGVLLWAVPLAVLGQFASVPAAIGLLSVAGLGRMLLDTSSHTLLQRVAPDRIEKGTATAPRRRLDAELVNRSLAPSRERARALVVAGQVLVSGSVATKPDRQVSPAEPIVVLGPPPRFVGRGALKLDAALDRFAIDVTGVRAIDVGASTGGFTDCLLQRGASEVVALDVGYGQLHERLRADARVRSFERTNVRDVDVVAVGGPARVVVVDVSFISLRTIAPALASLLADGGDLVALVKPQFEAGRAEVSRGSGVVRDVLLDRKTRERGLISVSSVTALIDDHQAGRAQAGDILWSLLNLELWYRTFIDGDGVQVLPTPAGMRTADRDAASVPMAGANAA
jgi:23S rRNA (cytidine1920-2'-O)/16S rRNA (cytidine1409-2'-O)-methyltransferase